MKNFLREFVFVLILVIIFSSIVVLPTLISGKTFYGIDGNIGVIKNLSESMWKFFNKDWVNNYLLGYSVGVPFNVSILIGKIIGYDKVPIFDVFIYIVVSFVGMYIFLRSSGISVWASLFGSVSISLTTMGVLSVLGGHLNGSLGFILLALGVTKYIYSKELSFFKIFILVFIVGVSLGISFTDVQRTLYFGLVLGAYIIFLTFTKVGKISDLLKYDRKELFRLISIPLLIFVVFFVFSLNSVVGSFEFVQAKQVGVDEKNPESKWRFLVQFSYPPEEILNFLIPGMFGYFSNDPNLPYWGRAAQDFEYDKTKQGMRNFRLGIDGYTGVFVLPFLILAFIYFKTWDKNRKRHFIFWLFVALFAFLFSIARYFPTLFWLLIQIPFFDRFRVPAKWMDIFIISIVILSSISFDSFVRELGKNSSSNRKFLFSLFLYSLVLFLSYLVVLGVKPELVMYFNYSQGYDYNVSLKIVENIANSIGNAFIFVFVGTVVLWFINLVSGIFSSRNSDRKEVVLGSVFLVFLVVVFVNMFLVVKPLFKEVDAKKLYSSNSIVNFLKSKLETEQARVSMYSGLANHYFTFLFPYHGLETIQTIAQSRLFEGYDKLLPLIFSFNFDVMAKFGTRYFLTELNPSDPVFQKLTILNYYTNLFDNLYLSESDRPFSHNIFVYEISNALPRFFVTPNYIKYNGEFEMLLMLPIEVLKNSVLIEKDISDFVPSQNLSYSIKVNKYEKDYVKLELTLNDKGFLVFNNYYHPSWKCFVDGKPKEIIKANYLVQSVYIDTPGKYIVEFKFDGFSILYLLQFAMFLFYLLSCGFVFYNALVNKV